MRHLIFTLVLLTCLGACGGSDEPDDGGGDGEGNPDGTITDGHDGSPISEPAEFCDAMANAMCYKLVTCYTAEERSAQDLPATESDCLAQLAAVCTPATVCPETLTYQPDLAGACISEIEALTCDDTRDEALDEPGPSCAEMCQ